MSDTFILFLFLLPAIVSLALCLIKDTRKGRGILLNILLILNALVYSSPLIYAHLETRPDGNMWSENGPGAALWLYFIILPLCVLALIVLLALKLVFRRKKRK